MTRRARVVAILIATIVVILIALVAAQVFTTPRMATISTGGTSGMTTSVTRISDTTVLSDMIQQQQN